MPSLADLHQAVQTTLAGKRLGTPVFVRYLYHRPTDKDALAKVAGLVGLARSWIGQAIDRLVAVGSVEQKNVSVSVEFDKGATALVSWLGTAGRGDGADIMVVGNHGAMYHDSGAADLWDDSLAEDPRPVDADLVAWIERALRSGRPEIAEKGGRP